MSETVITTAHDPGGKAFLLRNRAIQRRNKAAATTTPRLQTRTTTCYLKSIGRRRNSLLIGTNSDTNYTCPSLCERHQYIALSVPPRVFQHFSICSTRQAICGRTWSGNQFSTTVFSMATRQKRSHKLLQELCSWWASKRFGRCQGH